MSLKKNLCVALAVVGSVLAACAGQIPRATPQQIQLAAQQWPGVTSAALDEGRSRYISRCSACHTLYRPREYTRAEWPSIVERMQKEGDISDQDKEKILQYLLALSEK